VALLRRLPVAAGILAGALALAAGPLAAEANLEYPVKAAFLFNFTKFVDWPAEAFAAEKSPLTLCLYGNDPFGKNLDDLVANETVGGRPIAVRRVGRGADLKSCHVLFFSRAERDRQGEVLSGLRGAPVLTVGETAGFLGDGGMVRFDLETNRVRFAIDLPAAEKARLKISSKLLRLAKVKEEGP
jgi:hypothetical protein